MPANRQAAKRLIARQIGVREGFVWRDGATDAHQVRRQAELNTIGENILATIERLGTVRWEGSHSMAALLAAEIAFKCCESGMNWEAARAKILKVGAGTDVT